MKSRCVGTKYSDLLAVTIGVFWAVTDPDTRYTSYIQCGDHYHLR